MANEPSVTMKMVREEQHPNTKLKLLKQVADINETDGRSTNLCAFKFYPSLVKLALEKGADVNQRTAQTHGSQTVLIEIANFNGAEDSTTLKSLQIILAAKPDLDARDSDGCTALFAAIASENLKIANMLLDAGADPNVANNDGNTVIEDLLTWGRLDDAEAAKILKILLKSKKWHNKPLERAHARATANRWTASAKVIGSRCAPVRP